MDTLKKLAKEKIELTEEELSVYIVSLLKGYGTAGSIAMYLGMGLDKVSSILKALESKNLIRQAPGIVDRFLPLPPYSGFIKYLEDFVSETQSVTTAIKTTFDEALKIAATEFNNAKKTIEETTKENIAIFSENASKIKEKINQEISKALENLKSSTENASTNVSEASKSQIETIKAKITELEGNVVKSLDDEIANLEKLIAEIKPKVDAAFSTVLKNFKNKTDEFMTSFNTQMDAEGSNVSDQLNKTKGETTTILNSSKDILETKIAEIQDSIKSGLKNLETSGIESISNMKNEFSETITGHNNELGENLISFEETAKFAISNFQVEGTSALDGWVSNIVTKIGELETKIKSDVENGIVPIKQTISNTIKGEIEKTTQSGNEITENVKSSLIEYQGSLAESFNPIKELIGSTMETLKKFQGDLDKQVSTLNTKISKFQTDFTKKLSDSIESLKNGMAATETTSLAKMDEQKDALNSMIENIQQEFNQQASTLSEEQKLKIAGFSTSKIEDLSNIINGVKTKLEKSIKKHLKKVDSTSTSLNESLKSTVGGASTEIDSSVAQFRDELAKSIVERANEIEISISDEVAKLKEIIDTSKNMISGAIEKHKEDLISFKDSAINATNEQLNAHQDSFSNTLNAQKTNLNKIMVAQTSAITKTIDDMQKTSTKALQDNLKVSETTSKSINDAGINAISEADSGFQGNANELKGKINAQLDSTGGAIQEKIGGSADTIKDLFEKVIKAAQEPKEILEKAWEDILSMELNDAEKTWHLVGHASISNFIIDMFKRTKRSCLIAVPEFKDLPIQIILSELKRKALMIVTDVHGSPEKESIQKLIELGVDLRHLTGVDFYAASRDREEVLLAPKGATPTEYVALISEVTGIVDTLGEILGDYWRGKASKVREV